MVFLVFYFYFLENKTGWPCTAAGGRHWQTGCMEDTDPDLVGGAGLGSPRDTWEEDWPGGSLAHLHEKFKRHQNSAIEINEYLNALY